ncbi:MAG: TlpA disulfide reductase family protein [Thiohalocapsa sp.]|jgi:peroxiredoxin
MIRASPNGRKPDEGLTALDRDAYGRPGGLSEGPIVGDLIDSVDVPVDGEADLKYRLTRFLFMLVPFSAWALVAFAEDDLLAPMAERPPAPELDLSGIDGVRYRLADMRGRPVIINFWATWCPPCRAEMPSMQRAWEMVEGEGIEMLGINVGEDEAAVREFAERMDLDFPLPMDPDSAVAQSWPMTGLPTTFVVDPEGRIVYRAQGERDWADPSILDLVRQLMR